MRLHIFLVPLHRQLTSSVAVIVALHAHPQQWPSLRERTSSSERPVTCCLGAAGWKEALVSLDPRARLLLGVGVALAAAAVVLTHTLSK